MSDLVIKVPPLGESVSEATVSRWYKKVGDSVKDGEVVLELETDKVTLEVNAPGAGMIHEIKAPEGSTVAIGDVVGSIKHGDASADFAKELAKDLAKAEKVVAEEIAEIKIEEKILSEATGTSNYEASGPAAKKMMEEYNLDARNVIGTGKDGRITKEDVIRTLDEPRVERAAERVIQEEVREIKREIALECAVEGDLATRKPMTPLRRKIAERLKHAQNTAAILTTFNECDMSTVMELRKTYQDEFVKKFGTKLGFMSFFVKACVQALKENPAVNAEIDGEDMVFHHRYDIGVAVSAPQGLVVPVLRDADKLGLHEIEQAIAGFGEKAKANKLSMADLTGGTFTISNGGVFGSLVSTPILNPPQSAILGMHKIQERPVAINGQVVIRPMMYLALSYDHRIIDGREAVTFLVKVKEYIENPTRILLGI